MEYIADQKRGEQGCHDLLLNLRLNDVPFGCGEHKHIDHTQEGATMGQLQQGYDRCWWEQIEGRGPGWPGCLGTVSLDCTRSVSISFLRVGMATCRFWTYDRAQEA